MSYEPIFDWKELEKVRGVRPDGGVAYRYHQDLALAVNVALAAGRPLLLSGKPGTGKSSLAADVAWKLKRRFCFDIVTSKTEGQDLQWRFDAVKRLSLAASGADVSDPKQFLTPGVLWQAFAPAAPREQKKGEPAARPWEDGWTDVVVLIDEIDKAEPDVPNDLLVVLDQREFYVPEVDRRVSAPEGVNVLIVITTNGERDLPDAFVRRCITYDLPMPQETELEAIARLHFPGMKGSLITEVRKLFEKLGGEAAASKLRAPSTAELIDALRACAELKVEDADDAHWESIARASMWKHGKPKGEAAAPAPASNG